MSKAVWLKPEELKSAWPTIREYIGTSWPGKEEEVLDNAIARKFQLWLVTEEQDINGVFITQVKTKDEKKIVELMYLTGSFQRADFHEIASAVRAMQDHVGADHIEGTPMFNAPRFLKSLGGKTKDDNQTWRN